MNYNINIFKKPKSFEEGTLTLWSNQYIAENVIKKHFDFNVDCGSRNINTINKTINWLSENLSTRKNIIDLGCGPGIYAKPLCQRGFNYDGIDISKYQVDFAKKYNMGIDNARFFVSDIQNFKSDKKYDAALMLYAVYGMQSASERKRILLHLKNSLTKDGVVFVEVFNKNHYLGRKEKRDWEYVEKNGFWSPLPYLELNSFIRYDDLQLVLIQTIVLGKFEGIWNSWMQVFSEETLIKEFKEAGFSSFEIYGSSYGSKFKENSDILCMCAHV